MRLRRLALTDVAGVEASELVVAEQGVSVVLAPNEAGKSTLLRAYRLLLNTKVAHNAKRADVQALQPVGRDVGSTIEAELVIGDETFEVSRTYNRHVASSLTVSGRGATTTKTGKEADDLLKSRFLGAVDQDLFELLTFEQGRVLDTLTGGSSTTVMAALTERDADAGGAGSAAAGAGGAGGDGVIDAIRRRASDAFHATTGRPIGQLRKKEQAAEEAELRCSKHADQIDALTGGTDDADAAAQVAALREELADIAGRIARSGAAAKAATARKLLDAATEQVQQRGVQAAQVEQAIAEEQELTARVAATTQELAALAGRITELERSAQAAAQARATLVAGAAQAEADLLDGLARTVADLTATLAQEPVDATMVKRARTLEREVAVAQGGLEAGSWELQVTAGRPLTLRIDGEAHEVEEGAELTRAVSASLVLSDADGTVIDLHANADRRTAVAKLAEASAALTELLTGAAAADLDALEERLAARQATEARITELGRQAQELEADPVAEQLPSPSAAQAGADLDALEAAHTAALAQLDGAGGSDERELADAQASHTQRAGVLEQQAQELARSTERRTAAEQALGAAREGRSDDALAAEVTKAAAALEALGEVGEVEDVPALEALREQRSADLEEVQRRATLAEGRRSSAGAMAATLENLQENADALRAQFERDLREANAARMLRDRLEAARADQGDRYREPLAARIGELLSELYGYDCRVELDDDLRIVQRSEPDGTMVPWAQLSGGAKEQAAVVTGLAIAELAGDGGVPFWIDDAIVFSDDARVEGLKALLAATTAQVVVLTCRSELATGLNAAQFNTKAR